jgi:hypothetical protein
MGLELDLALALALALKERGSNRAIIAIASRNFPAIRLFSASPVGN